MTARSDHSAREPLTITVSPLMVTLRPNTKYYGRDVPTVPLTFAAFLSCLACRFSLRVRDAACFVVLPPLSFVGISASSLTVFVAPWHPQRVAAPFQLPVPARPRLTCGAPKLHLL